MAKIVKTLTVSWQWSGDKYSLRGFNLAVTPAAKNPKEEVVATAFVETKEIKQTYSYKMGNVTLDKDAQYKIWVQAVYENSDSDWVATGGATVSDDGSATIITKTDREIQDVVNMASDNILTRQEKVSLRREWQEIVYEFLEIESTAISQGIPSSNTAFSNFKSKGNALGTYLNGGEAWTISSNNKTSFPLWINDSNLGSNTSINGNTYRETFRVYYEAKVKILEEINKYKVNNVQVGGVNLLVGTATAKNTNVNVPTSYVTWDPYTTHNKQTLEQLGFKVGDKVTIGFDWSISKNGANDYVYGNFRVEFRGIKSDGTDNQYLGVIKNPAGTFSSSNTKGRVETTVALDSTTIKAHSLRFRIDNSVLNFKVSNLKMERGTKATGWSPALEEMENAYTVILTNEAQVIPTNSNRVPTSSATYFTDIQVYKGTTQRNDYAIGTINSANGITVSKTSSRVNFAVSTNTALAADGGNFVIPITIDGKTFNKTFSWSCSKQGNTGASGVGISKITEYYAVSSSNTTEPTSWSTTVPAMTATNKYLWNYETITYSNNTTANTSKRVIGVYGDKGNTGATGATGNGISNIVNYYLATSSSSGVTTSTSGWTTSVQAVSASKKYLWNYEVITYTNGSTSTTTPCIIGAYGDTGATGNAGQDAITIVLSNENHTFPCESNGNIPTALSTTCVVTAYKGGTSVTPTIGAITNPTGMTITKNGATLTIQANTGTSLADSGTVNIPITVDGKTFNKTFTWSKAKKGATGATGAGAKTADIIATSQVFKSTDGGLTFSPTTIKLTPKLQNVTYSNWQYSTNGGSSWANVVSGEKGMSIDSSNKALTVSKDSSLFTPAVTSVTFRLNTNDSSVYDTITIVKLYDVADLEIGGRNYLQNSNFANGLDKWTVHDMSNSTGTNKSVSTIKGGSWADPNINTLQIKGTNVTGRYGVQSSNMTLVANTTYTISGYCAGHRVRKIQVNVRDKQNSDANIHTVEYNPVSGGNSLSQYYKFETTFTTTSNTLFALNLYAVDLADNGYVWFANVKLEKGNKASDWTPAPEDVATDIDNAKNEAIDSANNTLTTTISNYYTKEQTNSQIDVAKEAINLGVSNTYETKANVETKITSTLNNAKSYADTKKNEAINTASSDATNKVNSAKNELNTAIGKKANSSDVYSKAEVYTKGQTDSAIKVAKDEINLGVSSTYETKANVETKVSSTLNSAKSYADTKKSEAINTAATDATSKVNSAKNELNTAINKKANSTDVYTKSQVYTKEETNSQIKVAKDEINLGVSNTYETKTNVENKISSANTTTLNSAKSYADTKKNEAISSASSDATTKANNALNNAKSYADTKKTEAINSAASDATSKVNSAKNELNTKIDNIQVGGRNLIRKADLGQNNSTATYDGATNTWTVNATAGAGGTWGCGLVIKNQNALVPYGKSYVLSFEIKVPRACSWSFDINNYALTGSSWSGNDNDNTSKRTSSSKSLVANQWIKCWIKWENTNSNNTNKVDIYDNSNFGVLMKDETSNMTYQIRNVKGELGNMPTEWTPAPEDVDSAINKKANSADVYTKTEVYTKAQTDSQINVAKDAINLSVSQTYETKTDTTTKINNAVNEIKIGGTNLITKKNGFVYGYISSSNGSVNNTNSLNNNQDFYTNDYFPLKTGESICFTSYPKSTVNSSIRAAVYIHVYNSSKVWQKVIYHDTNAANATANKIYTATENCYIRFCSRGFNDYNHMGEYSTKPSQWSPAPEDVSKDIANAKSDAINTASTDATNKVNSAKNELNTAINKKANSADVYTKSEVYTKAQTDSAIKVAKDEINLGVSNTYETKTSVETKINGISVGGTNLAYDTNKGAIGWGWGIQTNSGKTITDHWTDGINGVKMVKDGTAGSGWNYVSYSRFKRDKITPATTYVVSFEMKSNLTFNVGSVNLMQGDGTNTLLKSITAVQNKVTANSNTWNKIVFKLTTLDTLPSSTAQVIYITGIPYSANATHYFRNLKLEVGNTATTWSPAPEDVANDIANAKNEAINTASNDATNKVNSAKSALNTEINKKANSADVYKKTEVYTKNETNSQITAAKNEITQSVSNTYETKTNVQTKIDAISVGGTNLIKESKLFTGINIGNGWRVEDTGAEGFKKLYINTNETTWKECNVPLYAQINSLTGDVTVSFEYIESASGLLAFSLGAYKSDGTRLKEITNVFAKDFKVISTALNWKTVSYTFNPSSINGIADATEYRVQFKKVDGKSGEINVRKPQVERGNKATAWSPSPLDVDATMDRLKIDGTNLITKKRDFTYGYISSGNGSLNNSGSLNSNQDFYTNNYFPIKKGESITFASYPKSGVTSAIKVGIYIHIYNTSKTWTKCMHRDTGTANVLGSVTYTANTDGYVRFCARGFNDYNHKAVYGKNVGEWSPSPLDIEENVSNLTTRMSTAEQKITDTAITNTVKQNFYTKEETNNQITSKGYQTASQVQQTVDALQLKFTQSGGYNRIRNGIFKNGTSQWSKWGNPTISTKDDTGHSYGKSLVLTTTGTNQGVQQSVSNLSSGKKYTLSAYVYSWAANDCGIQIECGGSYYASKVSKANEWQRLSITFKATSTSATVQIGRGGWGANGQHLFTAIQFEEGELATTYTPHPNEVYDGIIQMDKDGIKVSTSNGGWTDFTSVGMNVYNKSSQLSLGTRNGGLTYHGTGEYLGFTSSSIVNAYNKSGVSISTATDGVYLTLGHSNATDPFGGFSTTPYLSIAKEDFGGSDSFYRRGVNIHTTLNLNTQNINRVGVINFKDNNTSSVYESDENMLCIFGNNGLKLGYYEGTGGITKFKITEGSDRNTSYIDSFAHWRFNNWNLTGVGYLEVVNRLKIKGASSIHFNADATYPSTIWHSTNDNKLNIFGDNGVDIGYRAGENNRAIFQINEGEDGAYRIQSYSHWHFHNWNLDHVGNVHAQKFTIAGTPGSYYITKGTGDGADYNTYGCLFYTHNGLAFTANGGAATVIVQGRSGRIMGKNAYYVNSSKCLKSDIRAVTSEREPMPVNLKQGEIVDETLTMEMIGDFIDTIGIRTYITDFEQEGATQKDVDPQQGHVLNLGYIADDLAHHPVFKYIGEKTPDNLYAINSNGLTTVALAGLQAERKERRKLEQRLQKLEAMLLKGEE